MLCPGSAFLYYPVDMAVFYLDLFQSKGPSKSVDSLYYDCLDAPIMCDLKEIKDLKKKN